MFLSDFFEQLTAGELSHMAIGGSDYGEILPADYGKVVPHINMGLMDLHTRFLLRESEVILDLQSGITEYQLHSRYAISNAASQEPIKYIVDSLAQPFRDNVLKVAAAYDEAGEKLPLNDESEETSIFTPRYDLVQVPPSDTGTGLSLIYHAAHEKLVATPATDPTVVEIFLHPSYHQALLFFVAARILTGKGADQGGNEGDKYRALYETECLRLERYNMDADSGTPNTRLEKMGWV